MGPKAMLEKDFQNLTTFLVYATVGIISSAVIAKFLISLSVERLKKSLAKIDHLDKALGNLELRVRHLKEDIERLEQIKDVVYEHEKAIAVLEARGCVNRRTIPDGPR